MDQHRRTHYKNGRNNLEKLREKGKLKGEKGMKKEKEAVEEMDTEPDWMALLDHSRNAEKMYDPRKAGLFDDDDYGGEGIDFGQTP
jgi:hypothetical protein